MKKLLKRIGICLVLAVSVWCGSLLADRQILNDELIRFHVVANSDSEEDQSIKLQVRDAILQALPETVLQADDTSEAEASLRQALPALHLAAQRALYKAHSPQTARLRLEQLDFAARDYGSFTLPGGRYTALRVELGEGKGHNWFCVLYPALCVSGAQAAYPTQEENALVFGRYEVRLAVVDAVKNFMK